MMPWTDWIRWEHEFQQTNLRRVYASIRRPFPRHFATRTRADFPRLPVARSQRRFTPPVRYPGRVPHLVAISPEDGSLKELRRGQGAVPYRVTSLAYDPAGQTLFYTTDNATYRNLMAYDLTGGESRDAARRPPASETSPSTRSTARSGAPGPTTGS